MVCSRTFAPSSSKSFSIGLLIDVFLSAIFGDVKSPVSLMRKIRLCRHSFRKLTTGLEAFGAGGALAYRRIVTQRQISPSSMPIILGVEPASKGVLKVNLTFLPSTFATNVSWVVLISPLSHILSIHTFPSPRPPTAIHSIHCTSVSWVYRK
jgi:hypothetical protein